MVTKTGVKKLLFYSYLIIVHQEIQKKLDSGKHIRDNNKMQLEPLCKQNVLRSSNQWHGHVNMQIRTLTQGFRNVHRNISSYEYQELIINSGGAVTNVKHDKLPII